MTKTLSVPVEGIGDFVFRHRTMRDDIRIQAEIGRLLGGDAGEVGEVAVVRAESFATISILLQEGPPGWSVEALDPLDRDAAKEILKVWGVLRIAEDEFRGVTAPNGAGTGAGTVRSDPVPVAASVQPAPDGPAIP
ncbi:hypothetical protein LDL36_20515 [Komagataeibacter sp. FNDCR1]|nr:hypothetical protein [Komagataeibacter sp. FNDCR1]